MLDRTKQSFLSDCFRQELQRLRDDERLVERDLMRINRDLAKTTSLPSASRSPASIRNQSIRLSVIAEERSSVSISDQPKNAFERLNSIRSPRIRPKYLTPIPKRSTMMKSNPSNDLSHVLPKQSFQQLIAKTSDDRLPHQSTKFKQPFLHS